MGTIKIIVSIAILMITSHAQAVISQSSARLENLRKSIELHPTNSAKQKYLRHFRELAQHSRKHSMDQTWTNYPTHEEHLVLLQKLFNKYPIEVRSIWFGVGTNCLWEADDALGNLRHQLASFGANDTKVFVAALLAKPEVERHSIIRFLADVENHGVYDEYKTIQKNLRQLGVHNLEKEFTAAKNKRIKERDHAF